MTRARGLRDDRGSLTAAMVIWTPVMLLLAAFVVDVGFLISSRDKADNIAEQAARRVADDLDQVALRDNPPWLVVNAAGGTDCTHDAQDYVDAYTAETGEAVANVACVVAGNPAAAVAGQPPPANPPVVTVTLTIQSRALFSSILSIQSYTVTGTGTARPVGG